MKSQISCQHKACEMFPSLTFLAQLKGVYDQIMDLSENIKQTQKENIVRVQKYSRQFISEFNDRNERGMNKCEQLLEEITKQEEEIEKRRRLQLEEEQSKQQIMVTKEKVRVFNSIEKTVVNKNQNNNANHNINSDKSLLENEKTIINLTVSRNQRNFANLLLKNEQQCRLTLIYKLKLYELSIGRSHNSKLSDYFSFICAISARFCLICLRNINGKFVSQHFKQFHPKIQNKGEINNKFTLKATSKNFYEIYSEKIKNKQLVLLRCGCSDHLFQNENEFRRHLRENHQSVAPKFSSHVLERGFLKINQDFSQFHVLQDHIMRDFYYCGLCDNKVFMTSEEKFHQHLIENHSQNSYHRNSSHYLPEHRGLVKKMNKK